jgi:hypothetical protein
MAGLLAIFAEFERGKSCANELAPGHSRRHFCYSAHVA